jgi:hypothetical protein
VVEETDFQWNGVKIMPRLSDMLKVVFPVEVSSKPANLLTNRIPTARRTSLYYMKCGHEQPLAQEHRDKPGASVSRQSTERKNRGGDVKRAGVQRAQASRTRTSEHDRPISVQPNTMVPACSVVGGTPGGRSGRSSPLCYMPLHTLFPS